jgi:hypothetical protein
MAQSPWPFVETRLLCCHLYDLQVARRPQTAFLQIIVRECIVRRMGTGPHSPSGAVPPSATASIQSYVEYTGWLASADRDAPLVDNDVVPQVSETAAPSPVN